MNNKFCDKVMDFLVTALLCLFCLEFTQAQWLIDDEGCRTPDRGTGTCILANSCKPMVDFLVQNQPLSAQALAILRSYQCGFEGNKVKVCCPEKAITLGRPRPTTKPTPKPMVSGVPPPPDVTNHRNFNLLPRNCGPYSIDDKLLNGNKTALFEFPWMVLISYQTSKGPDFRCGGTLINQRYVLTAAHCIKTTLPLLGVRLGEHDTRTDIDCQQNDALGGDPECADPPQNIAIEEAIAHPSWNTPSYSNDIGLIRLATPANTNLENVQPVCLPTTPNTRGYDFNNGMFVTVTGWGSTETARASPDLLKVNIPVTPQDQCVKIFEKQVNITYKQVCAGGVNRTDSCSGDSGGPLQVVLTHNSRARYVQLGIVSFGPKLCGTNPGVYTKVSYFMDWILDTMKA